MRICVAVGVWIFEDSDQRQNSRTPACGGVGGLYTNRIIYIYIYIYIYIG